MSKKPTEAEIREKYRKETAEVRYEFERAIGKHWLIFRQMEQKTMNDLSAKLKELTADMEHDLNCKGNHPKDDECAVCFAEKNSNVCIDKKKTYPICEKHKKEAEDV
jgi:hypothetical protein